ncbi:MAG: methionine--tRNA ligase, partial [Pseudomonadota bacterium]
SKRQILVTSALPYANGNIHIGHLVEYIQTDIWVRFLRMQNHEVYYVGADDTHGTPIMLRAEKEGITPEQLIAKVWKEHKQDFDDFSISFDNYYSTHAPENEELSQLIYNNLHTNGFIEEKVIEQAYDSVKNMFLPDRFIKGECPKCSAKDQYGDNCEVCGAAYLPTELKNPYSVVSGTTPVLKNSTHYFFKLSDKRCVEFLNSWVSNLKQTEAINKLKEWLVDGELSDWDISRDAPYFGFRIPNTEDKYFYVWLDAPVGYYASFKNLCAKQGINFEDWVKIDSKAEQYHFVGKDILYFHTLFWPAMLKFSGFRTPTNVFAHGFLTVDGQKMSKSRGTFISARSYLSSGLNAEYLRYYFAAKLNASLEDIDLNLEDFVNRVNSDLVGKYVNIASRASGFIQKHFDGILTDKLFNHSLLEQVRNNAKIIHDYYEGREYNKAIRQIMELTDLVNAFVDEQKPWAMAKQNDTENLQKVCSLILECFRIISIYLKPILPNLVGSVEKFLNVASMSWHDVNTPFASNHKINVYAHLMQRIEMSQINHLLEINRQNLEAVNNTVATKANANEANQTNNSTKDEDDEQNEYISIDDFAKIDLRVAKIIDAKEVEGSKKLLQLTLDLGEESYRNVFSGIKHAYSPQDIIGKFTVVVANLAPRKMKFGISEGMVLAAGDDNSLHLIEPSLGAVAGMKIS